MWNWNIPVCLKLPCRLESHERQTKTCLAWNQQCNMDDVEQSIESGWSTRAAWFKGLKSDFLLDQVWTLTRPLFNSLTLYWSSPCPTLLTVRCFHHRVWLWLLSSGWCAELVTHHAFYFTFRQKKLYHGLDWPENLHLHLHCSLYFQTV